MNIRFIRQFVVCFTVFFLVLLLAGCGNATPTSHPTAIPTIFFADTFTPKPTSTVTSTAIPRPSLTRKPSSTPQPFNTPEPTETVELTHAAILTRSAPTYSAYETAQPLTQEAQSTLIVQFPGTCGSIDGVSLSPDGNWLTDYCGEFHVLSRDGHKKIVIPNEQLASADTHISNVFSLYWSKDSQYLYFSPRFCCADTDASGSFGALYRLELQSGSWVKMTTNAYFNYYSFSPTGRRLLYIPSDQAGAGKPIKFDLIDLKSGQEQWFSLQSFEQAWVEAWSQDGKSLVITAQTGNLYQENEQYALFVVSLDDLSFKNIISLSMPDAFNSRWFSWSDANITTDEVCAPSGAPCEQQNFYNPK